MEQEQRVLRLGAAVILCATVLRLLGSGILTPVVNALTQPEVTSFLLYLETGRVVRAAPDPQTIPPEMTPSETTEPIRETEPAPAPAKAVFREEDARLIGVTYRADRSPDLQSLLLEPLDWDLTAGEPAVLILSTHATESYTKTQGQTYQESSDYRTLDESYNMIAIGDRVAEVLEAGGIGVVQARDLHDYPSYNGSYTNSRETIEAYLAQYPSIRLVLDLHRDAADTGGGQLDTSAQALGRESAQLMLVVGTDAGGQSHENWEENLSLALKLHVQLEKLYPGITRDVSLRSQRFNQDLCPGALLVEVGAAGNTQAEAMTAAEALAQGILALAHGTQ